MKKMILTVMVAAVLGFLFRGDALMDTLANEPASVKKTVYYTSIEISDGDSLWSIAQTYAPDLDLTTEEYIDCLRQMNHIRGDVIHSGRRLTVMYCGSVE